LRPRYAHERIKEDFELLRKPGLLAIALALLILPGLAVAQMMDHGGSMGGHSDGPMHGHMGGRMDNGMPPFPLFLRAAHLTPDQDKQVQKILGDSRVAFDKLSKQMRTARDQMADKLLSAGPLSASDLTAETTQINQAQQQLLAGEVSLAMKIRAVLKPDQLQKIASFHQQMKSLHDQMHALIAANCGPSGSPNGAPPPPPPGQ
jgi:Spy/CpxP family protein refolding chaperone